MVSIMLDWFSVSVSVSVLLIRTGMREIIELIRKHQKIRRILRRESPYFQHCLGDIILTIWKNFENRSEVQLVAVDAASKSRENCVLCQRAAGLTTLRRHIM